MIKWLLFGISINIVQVRMFPITVIIIVFQMFAQIDKSA